MPRYFFHLEDHTNFPDEEGTVLPDLATARLEAVRVAGGLLNDNADEFWSSGPWRVVVTDDAQLVLFSVSFEAVGAPSPGLHYEPPQRRQLAVFGQSR